MNYFSKEYWRVSVSGPLKFVKNTKFPFIGMMVRQRRSGVYEIRLNDWDVKVKNIEKVFHYKKLTKTKYEEILYSFLRNDEGKYIILNYLFRGNW